MKLEDIPFIENEFPENGYTHCPACKSIQVGEKITTNNRFGEIFICINCEEIWFVEGR